MNKRERNSILRQTIHMLCLGCTFIFLYFFFFNDTATTEIYTLSLHDALPIYSSKRGESCGFNSPARRGGVSRDERRLDRKSTRLNSSHLGISYAVFCLKKKNRAHKSIDLYAILRHPTTTTTPSSATADS